MRCSTAPPREISLLALLSLQKSAVNGKASRVFTKLFHKVMKDEHEENSANPLGDVALDALLVSLDELLQTMEEAHLIKEKDKTSVIKHASEMSKDLMIELIKCRSNNSIRETLDLLGDSHLTDKLLTDCEHEMGIAVEKEVCLQYSSTSPDCIETSLAELINKFAEAAEGSDKQLALIGLVDFKNANQINNLEAHLPSYLSPHFKEHILDQVGKASKENHSTFGDPGIERTSSSFNERMNTLRLKVGQEQAVEDPPVTLPVVADKAASLRARLEALKHSKD